MQVIPPTSPRATSPVNSTNARSYTRSPRRIAFELARVSNPSSAMSPSISSTTTTISSHNTQLGVVDLTHSPVQSPCSSNPSLSLSPSAFPATMALAVPTSKTRKARSPAYRYHSCPLPISQSTPVFPAGSKPVPTLLPSANLAPPSRASSPRKRPPPLFILPNGGSDRDQDKGEAENPHDDSDDSDRTSFFSGEEFVVPVSVLRSAVNARGRTLDPRVVPGTTLPGWSSSTSEPGHGQVAERSNTKREDEQDAAHGLRRWHALMEIMHTEAGYVRDLRTLAKVYLTLLPSLPLTPAANQVVQDLSHQVISLLVLHERFLLALQDASAQATGGASPIGSVHNAVQSVASLFVQQAPAFDLYQNFCATQPDALRLLRSMQARPEWAAFEQRCASGGDDTREAEVPLSLKQNDQQEHGETTSNSLPVSPTSTSMLTQAPTRTPSRRVVPPRTLSLMPSAFKAYASASASSSPTSQPVELPANTRRHSYDSLAAVFSSSGSGGMRNRPTAFPLTENTSSSTRPATPASRLRFHDFLIKPVQRICKYPLMLEGLRCKTRSEGEDATIVQAVESMRAVAMRVDEAKRQKEAAMRSKLIIERLDAHPVVSSDFIKSLGDCLLAGSLDVVHHHHFLEPITNPVRVRYLGAFLYPGGYILLVKIVRGQVYRIKHWFSLVPFELVDIPQDTALVPCSFRLSYMDHHFEIAAACQREKDLWMRAINQARSSNAVWTSEPISSLQIVQVDTPLNLTIDGSTSEGMDPSAVLTRGSSSSSLTDQSNPLAVLRLSATRNRSSSSSPAVRLFSLSDGSSILLRRSSSTKRLFVDRALMDVFSDLVSSLRKQAQARDEILFSPPLSSDAPQPISIAAKNKLMKRGSMLIARPRTLFTPGSATTDFEEELTGTTSSTILRRTVSSRTRLPLLPALTVMHADPEDLEDISKITGSDRPPFDKTLSPSGSKSLPSSPTEVHRQFSQSSIPEGSDNSRSHRRARSLVGSVRDIVRRATVRRTTTKPSLHLQANNTLEALRPPNETSSDTGESTETVSGLSASRRRVSSAPSSPPVSPAPSILHSNSISRRSSLLDHSQCQVDPLPESTLLSSKPFDQKATQSSSTTQHSLNPRRSFKKFMFYHRLTSNDSA